MISHTMISLRHGALYSLLAAMFILAGCSSGGSSKDENIVVTADDDLLDYAALDDRGSWSSAPFQNSPWIPFGPGAEVQIEHGLGRVPTLILSYISYTPDDRNDSEPRVFSAAAGDVANVLEVNETYITFKNRTRGKFAMRVVLQ